MVNAVLEVCQPIGIEASLEVLNGSRAEEDRKRRALELAMERARSDLVRAGPTAIRRDRSDQSPGGCGVGGTLGYSAGPARGGRRRSDLGLGFTLRRRPQIVLFGLPP